MSYKKKLNKIHKESFKEAVNHSAIARELASNPTFKRVSRNHMDQLTEEMFAQLSFDEDELRQLDSDKVVAEALKRIYG